MNFLSRTTLTGPKALGSARPRAAPWADGDGLTGLKRQCETSSPRNKQQGVFMSARELAAALDAVERASIYLMDAYARFEVVADAPADITTEADRGTQEIVLKVLHEYFPTDAFCAEESTP